MGTPQGVRWSAWGFLCWERPTHPGRDSHRAHITFREEGDGDVRATPLCAATRHGAGWAVRTPAYTQRGGTEDRLGWGTLLSGGDQLETSKTKVFSSSATEAPPSPDTPGPGFHRLRLGLTPGFTQGSSHQCPSRPRRPRTLFLPPGARTQSPRQTSQACAVPPLEPSTHHAPPISHTPWPPGVSVPGCM